MQIANVLDANLIIGGCAYALSTNTFESICIFQDALKLLPECRLILDDVGGFFESVPLVDGMPILIQMRSLNANSKVKTIPFVLSGKPDIVDVPNGKVYTIYGIYANPKYFRDRPFTCYNNCNSSQAIARIATECGFKPDVNLLANDYMDWYSGSLSYGQWAQRISDYAYFKDGSCAMVAVTEDGVLKYKNISDLPLTSGIKGYFYKVSPIDGVNSFKVESSIYKDDYGADNYLYGYKYKVIDTKLDGGTDVFSKITFNKRYSNKVNINKNINNNVSCVRAEFGNVDCGNTHPNYWKAYHQNKRLRCLYSSNYLPVISTESNIQLFDLVKVESINSDEYSTNYTSTYIVVAKVKMISDDLSYHERFLLSTTGKNINNINLV